MRRIMRKKEKREPRRISKGRLCLWENCFLFLDWRKSRMKLLLKTLEGLIKKRLFSSILINLVTKLQRKIKKFGLKFRMPMKL
jgi:hypothetical protein